MRCALHYGTLIFATTTFLGTFIRGTLGISAFYAYILRASNLKFLPNWVIFTLTNHIEVLMPFTEVNHICDKADHATFQIFRLR